MTELPDARSAPSPVLGGGTKLALALIAVVGIALSLGLGYQEVGLILLALLLLTWPALAFYAWARHRGDLG
jgi:hypothetical protein